LFSSDSPHAAAQHTIATPKTISARTPNMMALDALGVQRGMFSPPMKLDPRRGLALVAVALSVACSAQDAAPARPNGVAPIVPLERAAPRAANPADASAPDAARDAGAASDGGDAGPPLVLAFDYLQPVKLPSLRKAPATRLASLSSGQCRAELKKRAIASKRAGIATPGVATPLRLAAELHGVRFIAPDNKYGVLDCRLAIAIDELAQILVKHGVSAVLVDSMYRPKARLNGTKKPSQHSYGLAIDIMGFELEGRRLMVKSDWHGSLSAPSCGPGSQPVENLPEAAKLRSIVCDVAEKYLFHHMLTPNYNEAHSDHLHFDVKRDSEPSSVH
jgi:hypothetical protein